MPSSYLQRTTPGVYVTELDAFPSSIVGVQTALPAFIGYTEKAIDYQQSAVLKPTLIHSLEDYRQIFGGAFKPIYHFSPIATPPAPAEWDVLATDPESNTSHYFNLRPTTSFCFYLYNSLRLFYANGGGACYVVSVGVYQDSCQPQKTDLLKGLSASATQAGPSMLVVPDAISVSNQDDFQEIAQAMLEQCGTLQDRFAILDVYNVQNVTDQESLDRITEQFQNGVGTQYLSYGAAYFPYLQTSIVQSSELDYTNFALEDPLTLKTLKDILTWQNKRLYAGQSAYAQVQTWIDAIGSTNAAIPNMQNAPGTPHNLHNDATISQNLARAIPLFQEMLQTIANKSSVLAPSGAMAGLYATSDNASGVWNAPANMSLNSVSGPTFTLNDAQQEPLNTPLNGKAINAIRAFPNRGSVVWGARTLDGNSADYRYIQVRRTLIYIEQSIKNALQAFVFAANDSQTWVTVTAMISGFLQGLWSQGGLMGDKASDAFTVTCGLGSTMTAQDVLNGYMVVGVTLQIIHPAEFIELSFTQKMGQ